MRWLKSLFGKKKESLHENNTSHTQKLSKSNKLDTTYRSDVTNNGSSRGRTHDPQHGKRVPSPHRSEHQNRNSDQTRHVHKRLYSVKERIEYIGDYIDYWNKNNPQDYVKIDIIVLGGLLDINQNLTEPRSGSKVKFICKPEKPWDKLSSEKLQSACKMLKWHTNDLWYPYTLDSVVRKRMFEVIDKDRKVHKSKMRGLIIRRPPLDYRICQHINRLGRESNPELYDTKLSGIVDDIESYINSNKQQLESTQYKSKKDVTPRKLIEKWQKEYRFDFSNVLLSLKNNKVDPSKPREDSGTRSRHESHRVNGPHDSAISLPAGQRAPCKSRTYSSNHGSESDTSTSTRPRRVNKQQDCAVSSSSAGERAPSKSQAHKKSDDVPGSDTSIHPRRRTPNSSQPLIQNEPQTKPKRDNWTKTTPYTRPPITIQSPSKDRGRSSSKSPHRKLHGRSPRTPRTPQTPVNKNPGKPPLPPSLYPLDHEHQKSPVRPGSGGRGGIIPKRGHLELLHPSTSRSQSNSYPDVDSYEMGSRSRHPDLAKNNTNRSQQQQQQHLNSQLHSQYVNREDGYPRPFNEDPDITSPVKPEDMLWQNNLTREEKDKIHKKEYDRLRSEDD